MLIPTKFRKKRASEIFGRSLLVTFFGLFVTACLYEIEPVLSPWITVICLAVAFVLLFRREYVGKCAICDSKIVLRKRLRAVSCNNCNTPLGVEVVNGRKSQQEIREFSGRVPDVP